MLAYRGLSRGDLSFPFPDKRFLGIRTNFVSQSARSSSFNYRTQDWLRLKAECVPDSGAVTYKLVKPNIKPFPLLITVDKKQRKKHSETFRKVAYFPTPLTPEQLLAEEAKRLKRTVSQLENDEPRSFRPRRAATTLARLSIEWEESSARVAQWRRKFQNFGELPREKADYAIEESLEVEISEQKDFVAAVDQKGLFNESASSSVDDTNKSSQMFMGDSDPTREAIPVVVGMMKPQQRKFRKLRRATRNLIAWIESLRPQKKLNFHLITLKDGTRQNVNMRPYLPFPEEFQPVPVIKEDEIVDLVQNAYGTRPALALKVDIHDMDKLPEELEKFDNYYYLRERLFARLREREKSLTAAKARKLHIDVGNKYSFGFRPAIRYHSNTLGNVFDATTRRRCRYGVWYLDRALWRKMEVTEEMKRPGASESDEAFERVTGQKPLQRMETPILDPASPELRDLCDLYTSKEFYKRLVARERAVPTWLEQCREMIEQDEREKRMSRTAPHGSEVWRKRRISRMHSVLHLRLKSTPHPHFPRRQRQSKANHVSVAKRMQSDAKKTLIKETAAMDSAPRIDTWCYDTLYKLEST
ncbi:uncharacterized protein LOC129590552 isoform X2 [Paramacrobiotus metropolitanus]|uniref:uncharacterized protein LOC129590552 isoform X2 n=1 Tax=Paramacrobiotus metropolitanus TaxID=2943436 RepID=UPI0024464BD0|nr:uncharacterized protein LOC129590552 isoform X2 [Paramacrobiotus metropolitanus]